MAYPQVTGGRRRSRSAACENARDAAGPFGWPGDPIGGARQPGSILGRSGGCPAGHPGPTPCIRRTLPSSAGIWRRRRPQLARRRRLLRSAAGRRLGGRTKLASNPPRSPPVPHGWQFYASRTRNQYLRDIVLLPAMTPSARALVRSQAGPHAGSWLTAIPAEPATTLTPQAMQLALRRRLRMPLPISHGRCGPTHGCGGQVDRFGDHALACLRTGLLARRAKTLEHAWVRVAREAVGAEGQVVPQQWLVHTTAPGVHADDRRRLDVVIYGATTNGTALCCDATLVSPLTRTGQLQPCTADLDGAALRTAERRKEATYPELRSEGPQRLVVLGSEVGGRFNSDAHGLLRDLVRVRACRAPPALRAAAASGWTRRWWSILSVAVQQAVTSTALGRPWPLPPHAARATGPPLDRLLDLAEGPSRLPLRPAP